MERLEHASALPDDAGDNISTIVPQLRPSHRCG